MTTYPKLQMHIRGQWIGKGEAGSSPVINPATEAVLGDCPYADQGQLDAALDAANAGFAVWSRTPAIERFQILRAGTELLRERAEEIARVMTAEQGKPFKESHREVTLSADIIDFLAEEAKRQGGRLVPSRSPSVLSQQVRHEPIGPVLALTPWNFPVNLPARKLGGALAAGCSAILKPANETPASAQLLVKALVDGGLPDGVLNLVYGDPAKLSDYMIRSPITRKVSFTGSTQVGKLLGALAARHMKRFTPELGGHAPVIVTDSADLDSVVKASVAGKYRNAGQVCISPTRFYVQRGIYDRFVADFAAQASKIRVGDASTDSDVEMGPLTHARRVSDMVSLLEEVGSNRGEIVTGGKQIGEKGFFFEPTVVAGVPDDARLMTNEPFGPIAGIALFDDLAKAVTRANSLPYGLGAYAFCGSLDESQFLANELRAGMVGINHFGISTPETPFGGVGDSGFGSESGVEGYLGYTDTKFVSIAKAGS